MHPLDFWAGAHACPYVTLNSAGDSDGRSPAPTPLRPGAVWRQFLTPTPSPWAASPQPVPQGGHERRGEEAQCSFPSLRPCTHSQQPPPTLAQGPRQNVPSTWILNSCRSRSDMWENLQLGPKSHWPAMGRQSYLPVWKGSHRGLRGTLRRGRWSFRGRALGTRAANPSLEKNLTLSGAAHMSSPSNLSGPSWPAHNSSLAGDQTRLKPFVTGLHGLSRLDSCHHPPSPAAAPVPHPQVTGGSSKESCFLSPRAVPSARWLVCSLGLQCSPKRL